MTLASSQPFTQANDADTLATNLEKGALLVVDRHEEMQMEYPPLPFSTALLLEEATALLEWTVARVTETAQRLFEAGLITYPRTDSTHLAPEAIHAGQQVVRQLFGPEAVGAGESLAGEAEASPGVPLPHQNGKPRWWNWLWQARFTTDHDLISAEANDMPLETHEAIRPTDPTKNPETLRGTLALDDFAIYNLIWVRFLASLMKPARYRVITVDLETIP